MLIPRLRECHTESRKLRRVGPKRDQSVNKHYGGSAHNLIDPRMEPRGGSRGRNTGKNTIQKWEPGVFLPGALIVMVHKEN